MRRHAAQRPVSVLHFALFVLLILCAAPAQAGDWGRYENARFGYAIDIPPDFIGQGEAENGDGQMFANEARAQQLIVFGGNIIAGDFSTEAGQRMAWATDDGWTITYQASTPSWTSFSGKRGSRILYTRMIALCDPSQFAMFTLEYSRVDMAALDPVVTRLVRSLAGTC